MAQFGDQIDDILHAPFRFGDPGPHFDYNAAKVNPIAERSKMESINEKPDKQLTGLCGEHYVSALLAGHGLVVALPRGGSARSDLFVADSKRGRAIRVQVKAGRQSHWQYKRKYDGQAGYGWDTDRAIINSHDEGLWYAFVSLGEWPMGAKDPVVFFVPSAFVATRMELHSGEKRPFFWGFESDLMPYHGAVGIARLKTAIAKGCLPPASAPHPAPD